MVASNLGCDFGWHPTDLTGAYAAFDPCPHHRDRVGVELVAGIALKVDRPVPSRYEPTNVSLRLSLRYARDRHMGRDGRRNAVWPIMVEPNDVAPVVAQSVWHVHGRLVRPLHDYDSLSPRQ